MFSSVSQASKCALVKLVERLNKKGFELLDIQFTTPHLEMFGAVEIEFEEYQRKLLKAYSKDVIF
jgi:leucyl/phenylalanyl-tRNA--protein transferase